MIGVTDLYHGQIVRIDLEHRHIGGLVASEDLGLELAPIGKLHRDFIGIGDHMGTCTHKMFRRKKACTDDSAVRITNTHNAGT